MADQKEPFVPSADRPEVKIDPETPVSELKVRDLHAILGAAAPDKLRLNKNELHLKGEHHVELQKTGPETKQVKFEKVEKLEIKEVKHEKNEAKEHKIEKHEIKEVKHEKVEFKEHKVEKFEKNEKVEVEHIPGQPGHGGDPEPFGIAQLAEHIGGLHKKIDDLTNQIAEMKKTK